MKSADTLYAFALVGEFAAMRAAETWLEDHDYSVGPTQGKSPRGILKGEWQIAKWRNLSPQERAELDGEMTGDMRSGPVIVAIKSQRAVTA